MLARAALACPWFLLLSLLAGCGGPTVELVDDTLDIVHVSPHHGAVDVARDVNIAIGFSAAVDPISVAEHLDLVEEGADGVEKAVEVRLFVDEDGFVVTLVPANVLASGARHRVRIADGLAAVGGASLPAPFKSEFVTRR